MKNLCVCAFLLFLAGCQGQKESKGDRFFEEDLPEKIKLQGEKLNFEGILNPKSIIIKDGYLLVSERKNIKDEKFHVIDVINEKYLYAKGKDGMGPNEITLVYSMDDAGEPNMIWAYDIEQRKFSKFDISNPNLNSEGEFRSPEVGHFITYVTWTSDSSLLANLVDGWEKFIHITKDGEVLDTFGSWKDNLAHYELPRGYKKEELDPNLVSGLFNGNIRGNVQNGICVMVGVTIDYIEIVDLNTRQSKMIRGPIGEMPDFKITHHLGYQMPEVTWPIKTHYTDSFVGKKSIFVLYKGVVVNSSTECRIFELDFDGNFLNQFELDFPLHGFVVEELTKTIYGVSADREPNVVKFSYN